jgi:hypothetical protein
VGALAGAALARPWLAAGGLAVVLGLCAGSSWVKYRRQPWSLRLVNTVLYYFYYLGRALSLAGALAPGRWRKRRR